MVDATVDTTFDAMVDAMVEEPAPSVRNKIVVYSSR